MKTARAYPHLEVDTASVPAVGQSGGVLLNRDRRSQRASSRAVGGAVAVAQAVGCP